MTLLRRFETPALYRGGFVSVGNFDGVHLGHQRIVEQLVARARPAGVTAVVLTFDPHPLKLLRPGALLPSLTTLEYKAELLEGTGIDYVIAYPTDPQLLQLTPEEFFDAVLVRSLGARGIIEGPNFCFGKNRRGDIGTLRDLCKSNGVQLDVLDPIAEGGGMISSSAIRSLISTGKLAEARKLLGRPYRLRGKVIQGAQRGRSIGFPTANLSEIDTLVPADGVYAAVARIAGQPIAAAVSIGPNPTFSEDSRKVEAHLIDFSGDLYGHSVDLELHERIREIRRYNGRDELIRQIGQDVAAVRTSIS